MARGQATRATLVLVCLLLSVSAKRHGAQTTDGAPKDPDKVAGISKVPFGSWRGVVSALAPAPLVGAIENARAPPVRVFVYTEKEVPLLKLLFPPRCVFAPFPTSPTSNGSSNQPQHVQ